MARNSDDAHDAQNASRRGESIDPHTESVPVASDPMLADTDDDGLADGREHDLKQDPALEIQEKHARRKRALAEGRYREWFKLAVYRWPMGYGEKPWHVVGTSVAVIVGSALVYPLVGGVARSPTPAGTTVAAYDVLPVVSITPPAWLAELLTSVYFSVVTFTTLGYGDLRPASGAAEAVATVESFVGALLMALLVYVLGRRATW